MQQPVATEDARRMLQAHNAFYARIIDLIPKDLYRAKEETEESISSQKYYKHRKQPLAPDEKKADRKRKLTEKYAGTSNSEGNSSSLLMEMEAEPQTDNVPSSSQSQPAGSLSATTSDDNSNSDSKNFSSLREKLQERIRLLHSDRTSNKPHKLLAAQKMMVAKEHKQKSAPPSSSGGILRSGGQRSSNSAAGSAEERSRALMSALLSADSNSSNSNSSSSSSSSDDKPSKKAADPELGASLEFGTIHGLGDDATAAGNTAAGKSSDASGGKMARLKRMLEEAERKRARLNQLKSEAYNAVIKKGMVSSSSSTSAAAAASTAGTDGTAAYSFGDNVALNKLRAEQWADAMRDAGASGSTNGGTVDANKIKKAIKRIEKRKERSGNQWAERLDKQKAELSERIGRRELNISARKKGVDPAVLAAEKAAKEAEKGGSSSSSAGPAAKRPRLFMHYKNKEAEAAAGGAPGSADGKKGGASGGGKPPTGRAGGNKHQNRPGFEGKKQGFLNSSHAGGKKQK